MNKTLEVLIQSLDLTSLSDSDTTDKIIILCSEARVNDFSVAALCVYSKFIPVVRKYLKEQTLPVDIDIATVVNFPSGNDPIDTVLADTTHAIELGATEIDLVINYQSVVQVFSTTLTNDIEPAKLEVFEQVKQFVRKVKSVCGSCHLKVIIESGFIEQSLGNSAKDAIKLCSEAAIAGGADFLKTSTGKVQVNATISASKIMLEAIKASGRPVGFKVAGGIRTIEVAQEYLELVVSILGEDRTTPAFFRIGASSLLKDIRSRLADTALS